jgi:predicted RNA-binding protein with PIN domain
MPFLIDGHNLIGQAPGLSLSDAEDEAELVMLLRRFTTAKRGRHAVVIFDHGVYGHPHRLDGYGITCYFARSPKDADTHLVQRLRKLPRPREWTLVTSDREVARVAEECGVKVMSSQEFARQHLSPAQPSAKTSAAPEEKRDVRLSPAEVDEWLRLFEERPDEPI